MAKGGTGFLELLDAAMKAPYSRAYSMGYFRPLGDSGKVATF